MRQDQSLPDIWLISDERNDAALDVAIKRMPSGSGIIYRHYHLAGVKRYARFRALRRLARAKGHTVILADSALTATEWGADGIYGAPRSLYPRRAGLLHLATAHNAHEISLANRFGSDAVLVSPVFATNSHIGGATLGPVRFRMLAKLSGVPVIALGGMDRDRARTMNWPRWAAIDGLT